MIVVDASVAIKCLLPEDGSEEAEALLGGEVCIAPDLIVSECLNALWKNARRGFIGADDAREAALLLPRLGIRLSPCPPLASRALDLAIRLDHPVYDCFYLALAEAHDVAMITMDRALVRKCADLDLATPRLLKDLP